MDVSIAGSTNNSQITINLEGDSDNSAAVRGIIYT